MGFCTYCNEEFKDLTEEHVIPKMFYLKELRLNSVVTLKVPVCFSCNQSASLIQEQVRAWFSLLGSDSNKIANWLVKNEVKRSFERRPHLKKIIEGKLSLNNLRTPSGIYIGEATRVDFLEEDLRNVQNFLDRITRGVLFGIRGARLDKDARLLHMVGYQNFFKPKPALLDWIKQNQGSLIYGQVLPEVYQYWVGSVPGTKTGIVISVFYGKIAFMSFAWTLENCPENCRHLFVGDKIRLVR